MNQTKYRELWDKRLLLNRFRDSAVKVEDGWNPFDSDFARIAMSSPFRRLQDKAQVFPLEPNDFVRTRLTHSIEVSGVARSIGVWVENNLFKKGFLNEGKKGHIPSILASAGLAHDIGNPPFGHFGEDCIKKFFNENENFLTNLDDKEQADLLNFDGNVQGLRLLLRIGLSKDEFSYNLAFPTLATIIKYPKDSITGNKGKEKSIGFKKYGYYQSDVEKFKKINETLGLSDERHPLCYLLEAADDICYSASDVEDGFKKKAITVDDLLDILNKEYGSDTECTELSKKICNIKTEFKSHPNMKSLLAKECRIFAQTKMTKAAVNGFTDNHQRIITGEHDKELFTGTSSEALRKFFKDIAKNNFRHRSVVKSEIIGQKVLSHLMKEFSNAAISEHRDDDRTLEGKIFSLISKRFEYVERKTKYPNKKYLSLLMVIDYVSGMTDSYALKMYQELCGMK